jgi:signal transduction histidine kinase
MKTQAATKKIQLQNNIHENITIFADYDSLATVIRNLVSNAIKFTSINGFLTLNASEQDNMISITISDTGVGINPDDLDKIFNIEENFTTKGTEQEGGTGLGLIICKEFIEKNGGTIGIESIPGEGTTITISLPSTEKR